MKKKKGAITEKGGDGLAGFLPARMRLNGIKEKIHIHKKKRGKKIKKGKKARPHLLEKKDKCRKKVRDAKTGV